MLDYSFQTLHADSGDRVIFRGITGSRAYGTNREGSDEDIRDGAWSFDEIMALAESLQADIRSEIDACPLPPEPDLAAIDNLLRELQP